MKKHKSGFTFIELCIIIAIIALLAGILVGPVARKVSEKRQQTERLKGGTSIITPVITVGNNSYLRLGLSGTTDEHAQTILEAIATFEKQNPDKEIVGRDIAHQQASYLTHAKIFGIWILHKPKTKTLTLEQPTP